MEHRPGGEDAAPEQVGADGSTPRQRPVDEQRRDQLRDQEHGHVPCVEPFPTDLGHRRGQQTRRHIDVDRTDQHPAGQHDGCTDMPAKLAP